MRPGLLKGALWTGLAAFVAGGIVSARLDGIALVDLPFGPGMTGGPVIADAVQLAPNTETRPAAGAPYTLPDPLVIATEGDYPPFNFVDETGALRGLEVDFVYALCTELGTACRMVARDWEALLPGLRAGSYNAVAASLRIARPPPDGIVFTQPYFTTAAAYATHTDDAAGLREGPVAVEAGTRMAAYLDARAADGAAVRRYDDPLAAYQALADGEVRAVFDDAVRLSRWLADPSAACCALASEPVTDPVLLGEGVGFAVRADDPGLAAALDAAIAAMKENGAIAELSDRYLPFALN